MLTARIEEFIEVTRLARRVIESGAAWHIKYDIIFGEDISGAIGDLGIPIYWNDPDTTEQENCMAFVLALESQAAELEKVLEQIKRELPIKKVEIISKK